MLSCVGVHILQEFNTEPTKLLHHPKQNPGGGGLRQINSCCKVPLQIDFLALLSISLIFLRYRISSREVAAVSDWLNSTLPFHVMRDHPDHGAEILGGMWGARYDLPRDEGSSGSQGGNPWRNVGSQVWFSTLLGIIRITGRKSLEECG